MKTHVEVTRKALVLALLAPLALSNCNGCNVGTPDDGDTEVLPPTVDTLPQKVKEADLVVRGGRAKNNMVWVTMAHRDGALDLAGAEDSDRWEGTVPLQEGENTMLFFASDAQSQVFSTRVGPYTVIRDSTPPAVPTVDPYAPGVTLGGQQQVTLTFNGTKSADGNLMVDGVEKVARDGVATRWTYSVTVGEGEYHAVLNSEDDVKNASGSVTITVVVGDVPAPTLDAITSPNRNNPLVVSGGKAENTSVHLRWTQDGEDAVELSAASPGTTWSKSVRFQEGANTFWIVARRGGAPSPLVAGSVTIDTTPPAAPTVDAYPSSVRPNGASTVTLTFSGTKAEDGNLSINGVEVVTLSPPTSIWSVPLELGLGQVRYPVVSADALGNQSDPIFIELVVADVDAPTLDAVTSPTTLATQTIRGGKAAGTSVWLRGVSPASPAVEVVPANQTTRWSTVLNLAPGHNDFCVFAKASGVQSGEVCGMIAYLPPFTVNQVTSPTNVTVARLAGTKGAGFFVKMYKQGTTDIQTIVAEDNQTSWAHDLALVEGNNAYQLFAGMAGMDERTPEVPVVVQLDTMPPAAPVINPAPESPTGSATVTLQGTRDADGNLRLRKNQEGTSTQVVPRDGGTSFSVVVNLVIGTNRLCLSSADALGNASEEVCVTVVRVAGPDVTILAPVSGATLRGGSLAVEVRAVGGATSDLQVTEVRACLDGTTCRVASRVGTTDVYTTSLEMVGFQNGSTHTVSATGKNGANVSTTVSVTVSYSTGLSLLSNTSVPGGALQPRMAIDGNGDLHVVWMDGCVQYGHSSTQEPGKCWQSRAGNMPWDVFHRKKVGVGGWGAIDLVSDASGLVNNVPVPKDGDSREPDVGVDASGNIHVVWVEDGDFAGKGGDRDVVHRVWQTSTQTWGPITVVTASATDEYTPRLAGSADGRMHLVWDGLLNSRHEVFYSRWDAGAWSAPVTVSDNEVTGRSTNPAVAADATGCAHVVWQDNFNTTGPGGADADVYYRTVCGGSTLGNVVLVSNGAQDGESRGPSVAVDSTGLVSVVWADTMNMQGSGTDGDIWLSQFRNGAYVPGSMTLVSADSTLESGSAVVAVVPGNNELVIAWAERSASGDPDNADIWYNASVDGFFMDSAVAAANTGRSLTPAVVVDLAHTAHLAWEDATTLDPAQDPPAAGGVDMDIFYLGAPLN
jgi:hypothetical protein